MLENLTKIIFFYLPIQIALNPTIGVDLASIRILIPILFLVWLITSLKNKKIIIPETLVFLFFISFLFLSAFSLFFSENQIWSIRKLLFLLSLFPIFFVIYDIFSSNQKKMLSLLKFTVWGAVLTSLIGIFQFFLQFIFPLNSLYSFWAKIITPFLGESFSQAVLANPSWLVNIGGHTLLRSTAFFPDPHMLSFYLNITGLISLGIYFDTFCKRKTENTKNTYIYLIFFLIIISASFLTFSRGGYLGLIFGILFFGGLTMKVKFGYFINKTPALSIALMIILLLFAIPNPINNRLFSSFKLSEGSNAGRIQTWKQSISIIKKNPLMGVGLGNYPLSIKPSANYREPIYSHNTFFDIAAETGLLNTIFWITTFLLSIISFVIKFIKNKNFINLGLASALVSFLMHSCFETAIFSVHVLPVIILILSLNTKNE